MVRLNAPKWSEHVVCLTCCFRNVLRITTACTFSSSQPPNVLRGCSAFYILTLKCASRHNSVQFFTSHLPRWLRTRTFHRKNTVFGLATFLPFRVPGSSFFCFLFSESSHLCLSICRYCRKFDFWLLSIIGILKSMRIVFVDYPNEKNFKMRNYMVHFLFEKHIYIYIYRTSQHVPFIKRIHDQP